jgi:phage shock protein PspC (stress-responsive transcriptional regulator)
MIVFLKSLGAGAKLLNVLGCLLFLSINGVIIYITLAVIATTSTEDETNEWAI